MQLRIELILESDLGMNDARDKLRKSLTELLKETEYYKRTLNKRNLEIRKLKEQLKKTINKVDRVQKKLESIKDKTKIKKFDEPTTEGRLNKKKQRGLVLDSKTFAEHEIPLTLEFRTNSLKMEYSSMTPLALPFLTFS